jgi:cell wall-associated NlpC family hydrolase
MIPFPEAVRRHQIVQEARAWLGTPYHEAARVKGINGGVDCAQFIACVFAAVGEIAPLSIPYYSPQQFLHSDAEDYMATVESFARRINEADARAGDVVLYKLGRAFGHGAIIIDPGWPNIIHAWAPARMVVRGHGLEENLGNQWRERRFFTVF